MRIKTWWTKRELVKAVKELDARVAKLRAALDRIEAEWGHCSICPEGRGCNAPAGSWEQARVSREHTA